MDILKVFAADKTKEESGTEVQIGVGAYVTLARAGNKRYSRMLTSLFEANKFVLDRKDAEADRCSEEIMIEVMANTVLLGWRGIDYDGTLDIPYSIENAKLLLQIKDFRNLVNKLSDDFNKFKAATEDQDEKNSLPTPSGQELGVAS